MCTKQRMSHRCQIDLVTLATPVTAPVTARRCRSSAMSRPVAPPDPSVEGDGPTGPPLGKWPNFRFNLDAYQIRANIHACHTAHQIGRANGTNFGGGAWAGARDRGSTISTGTSRAGGMSSSVSRPTHLADVVPAAVANRQRGTGGSSEAGSGRIHPHCRPYALDPKLNIRPTRRPRGTRPETPAASCTQPCVDCLQMASATTRYQAPIRMAQFRLGVSQCYNERCLWNRYQNPHCAGFTTASTALTVLTVSAVFTDRIDRIDRIFRCYHIYRFYRIQCRNPLRTLDARHSTLLLQKNDLQAGHQRAFWSSKLLGPVS